MPSTLAPIVRERSLYLGVIDGNGEVVVEPELVADGGEGGGGFDPHKRGLQPDDVAQAGTPQELVLHVHAAPCCSSGVISSSCL